MVKKLLLMSAIWLLAAGVSHGQATPESPDGGGRGKSAREIEKYVRELEKDSLMRTTSWSVLIKDLETGEVVASHEPQLSLAGASITKLLTTGAALASLGGDFRYETKLGYDGQITDSTLYGTLYVIGGGDPTLGSDYREFLPGPDSLFSVWKKELKKAGIARVEGRVVGDDRYFTLEEAIDSWTWDDMDTYYGTGVRGLSFFENKLWMWLSPSDQACAPAKVDSVYPAVPGIKFVNRTETVEGNANSLWLNASPLHPLEHFLTGRLGAARKSVRVTGANRAAGMSLLTEFVKYLSAENDDYNVEISLIDTYSDASSAMPMTHIYTHYSPELRTIASVTNKYSDNMYAENILRTMGKVLGEGDGTYDSRRVELAVLDSIAPGVETINLRDGSGLSRMAFLNERYYTSFLEGMYRSDAFDDFFSSLATPGGEGTFKNTIKNCPTRANLHLKSGSMSGVRGLAGYSFNGDRKLCFTIMVNKYHSITPVSERLNRLLELISQY